MSNKKPYTAATLRELKITALTNGDTESLAQIVRFEKDVKAYFKLVNENEIRDSTGKLIYPEESIFLLVEGFRSADGVLVQPLPGELWKRIESGKGTVMVQEISSLDEINEFKVDSPVKVSTERKQVGNVSFIQAGPELFFVSADSLAREQMEEFKLISGLISPDEE